MLCLEDLREGLDNTGIFVAVDLYCVDKSNLGLARFTERLQDRGKFLK